MYPFPDISLENGIFADDLRQKKLTSLYSLMDWVKTLPYGRNSDRSNFGLVLTEAKGACSTKHALIATICKSHQIDLKLIVGIYLMSAKKNPAVACILSEYNLVEIPEAHCYLKFGSQNFDFTRVNSIPLSPAEVLEEEVISPDQIGDYKIAFHKKYLNQWAQKKGLNLDQAWAIREKCIQALERHGNEAAQRS